MKLTKSKEYWEKKISNEGDCEVGAGSLERVVRRNDPVTCCDKCGEKMQPNHKIYTWGSYQHLCGLCLDDIGNKYGWFA